MRCRIPARQGKRTVTFVALKRPSIPPAASSDRAVYRASLTSETYAPSCAPGHWSLGRSGIVLCSIRRHPAPSPQTPAVAKKLPSAISDADVGEPQSTLRMRRRRRHFASLQFCSTTCSVFRRMPTGLPAAICADRFARTGWAVRSASGRAGRIVRRGGAVPGYETARSLTCLRGDWHPWPCSKTRFLSCAPAILTDPGESKIKVSGRMAPMKGN